MANRRKLRRKLVVSTLLAVFVASAPMFASAMAPTNDGQSLDPDTRFYVPKPNHGAIEQIADLISSGNKADADLIGEMIDTPQAVWFTKGTPKDVQQDVNNTVKRAQARASPCPGCVQHPVPRLCPVLGRWCHHCPGILSLDRWLCRWNR
jgi:endoglucanase